MLILKLGESTELSILCSDLKIEPDYASTLVSLYVFWTFIFWLLALQNLTRLSELMCWLILLISSSSAKFEPNSYFLTYSISIKIFSTLVSSIYLSRIFFDCGNDRWDNILLMSSSGSEIYIFLCCQMHIHTHVTSYFWYLAFLYHHIMMLILGHKLEVLHHRIRYRCAGLYSKVWAWVVDIQ